MSTVACVETLYAQYERLERNHPSSPSDDLRRSLHFYRSEQAFRGQPSHVAAAADRSARWVRNLFALEAFVARAGRFPRQNNRLPRTAFAPGELQLANWVRSERRAGQQGRRCSYQIARLACVPGYSAKPLDHRWAKHLEAYREFTSRNGRAPSMRSTSLGERRVAGWAARQRFLHRQGRLPAGRVDALNRLHFWAWGSAGGPSRS
jgi:hypothetical protein